MQDDDPTLACAGCGERVGVYEPLWIQPADGRMRLSSYLNLTREELHRGARIWHKACVPPDEPA